MTAVREKDHVDVIIADDDPLLRQSVRLLLEGVGYACAEASDGRQAVELARRHPPRCVLLDLAMPVMDGFAVARALRADPLTSGIHIHCLTGSTTPSDRLQAQAAGCERFLTKPVGPEALLEAVAGPAPQEESAVTGLTLAEAESLLDWLESFGWAASVSAIDERGVTVRVICPPGLMLVRDTSGGVRVVQR